MVRIPRCGCLISYRTKGKDTYLTRSRLQAWSFLLEGCKKDGIVAKKEGCCIRVAEPLRKLHKTVEIDMQLQYSYTSCNKW